MNGFLGFSAQQISMDNISFGGSCTYLDRIQTCMHATIKKETRDIANIAAVSTQFKAQVSRRFIRS